jgi:uncharacterized membrane protein YhaH (DUF805 family)
MSLPRLRRRNFWLSTIAVWAVFFAAREILALEQHSLLATGWAAIALLALGTLATARLHDRGRSAWWLCAALVPVLGALWLGWELALRRGSGYANRFGPDPHQP